MTLQSAKNNFLRWQELLTALFLASLFILLKLEIFTQLTAIIVTSIFAAIQLVRSYLVWSKQGKKLPLETRISLGLDVGIAFSALALSILSDFSVGPMLLTYHMMTYLCLFCAFKAIATIGNAVIWGYRFNDASNDSYTTSNEINNSQSLRGAKYNASLYGKVNSICTALAYLGAFAFTAIIAFTQFGFSGSLPFESPAYFSFHVGSLFVNPAVMAIACFIPLVLFQFYFGLKGDASQRYERAEESIDNQSTIVEQPSYGTTAEAPNRNTSFNHQRSQLDEERAPQTVKADPQDSEINDWDIFHCCKNNSDEDKNEL